MTNLTLAQAITAVAPHASKDSTLPVLNGVRIRDGKVMATDRYTLAMVTLPADVLDPALDAFLTPADVKAGVVSIVQDGPSVVLTLANGATKSPEKRVEDLSEYPHLDKIATEHKAGAGVTEVLLNLDYLARFHGKFLPRNGYGRKSLPVTPILTFGADNTKAVQVTFDDYPEYVGAIASTRRTHTTATSR